MTFQRLVVTWHLKGRLIEFETVVGGPQCMEISNLTAIFVIRADIGKLHTADHRYQKSCTCGATISTS